MRSEELRGPRGLRLAADLDGHPATVADVLRGWLEDAGFRTQFDARLAEALFAAVLWETPPVAAATLSRPFECVVLDARGLGRTPDPEAFAGQVAGAEGNVAVFPNLAAGTRSC